ncbi:unnamed protein product [Cyprideis torosa]|uniref:Uncharacterized protein n=1 Tax=Cyprideis torosa TaxID=163714 RepID=A0A7R8WEQ7_9CRUS|nr:unnamed protein product [Cyprideis torosa]CAG0890599.1 unnamed protein product [Cyprideis torosa]
MNLLQILQKYVVRRAAMFVVNIDADSEGVKCRSSSRGCRSWIGIWFRFSRKVAKLMEMLVDTNFGTGFSLKKKGIAKQMAFDDFGLVDVLSPAVGICTGSLRGKIP